jgi:inhibitor of cysteine peptidase
MSMTRAALLTAALFGLAACQSPGAALTEGAQTAGETVVAVRDGETVLSPGQTLSIALPGNSSTGYAWTVGDFNEAVLSRGEPFGQHVTDAHPAGMVGVPGQTQYRFVAKTPGQTTVVFKYGRSWEPDAAPADTARYTITVR